MKLGASQKGFHFGKIFKPICNREKINNWGKYTEGFSGYKKLVKNISIHFGSYLLTYILHNVAIFGHQMSVQSMVPFQSIIQSKICHSSCVAHQELFASQIIGKLQKFRINIRYQFISCVILKENVQNLVISIAIFKKQIINLQNLPSQLWWDPFSNPLQYRSTYLLWKINYKFPLLIFKIHGF